MNTLSITAAEVRANMLSQDNPHSNIAKIFWIISSAADKGERSVIISPEDDSDFRPNGLFKKITEGSGGWITTLWGDSIIQLLRDLGYGVKNHPHWSRGVKNYHYYGQEGIIIIW